MTTQDHSEARPNDAPTRSPLPKTGVPHARPLTDTPDDQNGRPGSPTVSTEDHVTVEFTSYAAGQTWIDDLVSAALAATAGDESRATAHADDADSMLGPWGDEHDPEEFRSFIAGAANATEHHLRNLGVRIRADGLPD